MRKLASIQRVWKTEPIEGADRIEKAYVLGWVCVVPKGQFDEGDLAVYFEVDSFLPVRKEFEFLRSSSFKRSDILGEGFRLKTITLRGVLSQGLLMPLSVFNGIKGMPGGPDMLGADVTDVLGVRQWAVEERASTGGTIIGDLPDSVPKTEEVRVQSEPGLIDCFKGKPYYITTKMDGSSHSVSLDATGFHVCGHNYEYKDGSFFDLVKKLNLREKMEQYVQSRGLSSLTIQGELCAPGIQKNRLCLDRPHWYVFTVLINGERVGLITMLGVCGTLSLEHVPVEEKGNYCAYSSVKDLLERAKGDYPGAGRKEGIVIRTLEPEYCDLIRGPLSMKVINNEYLLKEEMSCGEDARF